MEMMNENRKTGIILGAGSDAIHTINMAREQGVYVVAFDGNPDAEGLKYANESRVIDISDMEAVCDEVGKICPDFTIPVPIGRYLITTAYVNEKFGFKGIRYDETNASTDKYLFHQKMAQAGLRNIPVCLVNNRTHFREIDMTYPAIMKPRYGSGSRAVYYIENAGELAEVMDKECLDEDFVLEQAVDGTEYGVDAAVIDGQLHIILIRKKINTPLPVRQAVSSISDCKEGDALYSRIYEHLAKAVEVLGYHNCVMNADIIADAERMFVIEMSPRPSGHNLHNLFVPMASGIDMAEEYIKFLRGEVYDFDVKNVKCMQIRYFDFENVTVKSIPTEKELKESGKCNLAAWKCNIAEGEYLDKVVNGHSIMGRGYFVVEGQDEEDLLGQSRWVLDQFRMEGQ